MEQKKTLYELFEDATAYLKARAGENDNVAYFHRYVHLTRLIMRLDQIVQAGDQYRATDADVTEIKTMVHKGADTFGRSFVTSWYGRQRYANLLRSIEDTLDTQSINQYAIDFKTNEQRRVAPLFQPVLLNDFAYQLRKNTLLIEELNTLSIYLRDRKAKGDDSHYKVRAEHFKTLIKLLCAENAVNNVEEINKHIATGIRSTETSKIPWLGWQLNPMASQVYATKLSKLNHTQVICVAQILAFQRSQSLYEDPLKLVIDEINSENRAKQSQTIDYQPPGSPR
jgi:hypothetical protein